MIYSIPPSICILFVLLLTSYNLNRGKLSSTYYVFQVSGVREWEKCDLGRLKSTRISMKKRRTRHTKAVSSADHADHDHHLPLLIMLRLALIKEINK